MTALPLHVFEHPLTASTAESAQPNAERALVHEAQSGSETAFATLVHTHMRRAYAVARAICATHEDAEDAVQDGFLHAYRALERFRPEQAFAAWLNRIVAAQELTVEAGLTGDRELVHAAMLLDPHAGTLGDATIQRMTAELLDATRRWLPQFWGLLTRRRRSRPCR
jgi:hypothetical protein